MTSRRDPQRDAAREAERAIERDIRQRAKLDFARLLAGRDHGSHMKGASPTPVLRRALLEIEHFLDANLDDPDGALGLVVLQRLSAQADLLKENLGTPAATLAVWLPKLLDLPATLTEFVRGVDMTWGRLNQETPFFDRADQLPAPDDPYTLAGVTEALGSLLRRAEAAL